MDECEAVCDRLTIMARGYMQCIGNTQHLKSLYGQGFIILIKLKCHSDDEKIMLKQRMVDEFGPKCSLKDEHMVNFKILKCGLVCVPYYLHTCMFVYFVLLSQVLLHYHIMDPGFRLSTLFTVMEKLKEHYPNLIEEYSISDASLEHVFLSFAKKKEDATVKKNA